MGSLVEALTDESKKKDVVKDCCDLIEAEVKDKGGISGLAIKAGYGTVKGIKPGFVEKAVEDLLPEFAKALEPIYADAKSANKPISDYFTSNSGRVADALLSITDAKAARAKSGVAKGAYEKLRGSAKKNVEQAVVRLGKLVEKYGA
ncbi:MAG TPA: hypothetical protein VM580_28570 [Labilithrix sp.]|nr:hypothetical protein [Labilithrix sp.]